MRLVFLVVLVSTNLAFGGTSFASPKSFGLVLSNPVDHPVSLPTNVRTAARWRSDFGVWGENFAEQSLRLRGFQDIHEFKSGSNGGIDRVAVKRGADGAIKDVKFMEVKTSHSRGLTPKLGQTRYGGRQMSRKWLTENFKKMRQSDDPSMRKLALDISRYRKTSGRTIDSLGEMMHINTKTKTVTGYMADGKTVKYSDSVERLLKNIQQKASSKSAQLWATRTLSAWDQISSIGMSSWVDRAAAQQIKTSILSTSGSLQNGVRRELLNQSRRLIKARVLARSAGPIAVVVGLAMDAKEMRDIELSYQRGQISVRQRNVTHAKIVGGVSGAFAGGWAGAATGTWLGAFGGPFAEITVPAGAILGGFIGGVGGYKAGYTVFGYAGTVWYDSIDATVRDRFEREWLATRAPLS